MKNQCSLFGAVMVVAATFPIVAAAQVGCPAPAWKGTMQASNSGQAARVVALGNDDIVIGGKFATIDGVSMKNIARWDGKNWHAMGTGMNGDVDSLAVVDRTQVIAGGDFNMAGGKSALHVARWDGNEWWPMGAGLDGLVWSLTELSDGHVMAGGAIAGGTKNVVIWDGTSWTEAGTSTNGVVMALLRLPNGDVIAGGEFSIAGGVSVGNLARWDGAAWSSVGGGVSGGTGFQVQALALAPNGDLLVAGQFTAAGGVPAASIARWDGTSWSALGSGLAPTPPLWAEAVIALGNGDVVVGGSFWQAGGQPMKSLARWDGVAWMPIGEAPNSFVDGLCVRRDSFVAVGEFSSIGGISAPMVGVFGCPPICLADCDLSGSGTIDDFICFQTQYALGDPAADCDGSGVLDLDDFICFQTLFALGC